MTGWIGDNGSFMCLSQQEESGAPTRGWEELGEVPQCITPGKSFLAKPWGVWTAPPRPAPPLHLWKAAACWLPTVWGNSKAHGRKQWVEHIRREGHGALRTWSALLYLWLDFDEKLEIGIMGISIVGRTVPPPPWMHQPVFLFLFCFRSREVDWVRTMKAKHPFSFLSPVIYRRLAKNIHIFANALPTAFQNHFLK